MFRIAATLLALTAALAAHAQTTVSGDPEAGREKASVCAACHGMDGNSQIAQWPKIAEQHAEYIARQTILVREQKREVAQMYPIVMNLSDQDIADIAAWYASQTVEPGVADESLVEAGRSLYHGGNPDSGVPACMGCHGPAGNGIPGAHYPMLRGQHPEYTADRLRRYREGVDYGADEPYSKIMNGVAANLTDDEIEAVSSYIAGLHRAESD
ncbi:MAG: c-type cytochrome [Wenzhouxiangellaceae bacterium]|nr:c-type cytochrome [Wenzhouxiangellaceae bacterium]